MSVEQSTGRRSLPVPLTTDHKTNSLAEGRQDRTVNNENRIKLFKEEYKDLYQILEFSKYLRNGANENLTLKDAVKNAGGLQLTGDYSAQDASAEKSTSNTGLENNPASKADSPHKVRKHSKRKKAKMTKMENVRDKDPFDVRTLARLGLETDIDSLAENKLIERLKALLRDESLDTPVREGIVSYLQKIESDHSLKTAESTIHQVLLRSTFSKKHLLFLRRKGLSGKMTYTVRDVTNPAFLDAVTKDGILKQLCSEAIRLVNGPNWKNEFVKWCVEDGIANKNERLKEELHAYADACFATGMEDVVQSLVATLYMDKHHQKKSLFSKGYIDVDTYNFLLRNWAKQGDISKQKRVCMHITKSGLKLTLQSYASLLECLGRQEKINKASVKRLLRDMQKSGLKAHDIPMKCDVTVEEVQYINKALREALPAYKPAKRPRVVGTGYGCPLLKDFSANTGPHANPGHGVLSPKETAASLEAQLQLENKDTALVKNIVAPKIVTRAVKFARMQLKKLRAEWRTTLKAAFKRDVKLLERESRQHTTSILPYLKVLTPDAYVDIMMSVATSETQYFGTSLTQLQHLLGEQTFIRCRSAQKKNTNKTMRQVYKAYLDRIEEESLSENHREIFYRILAQKNAYGLLDMNAAWPDVVLKAVGKFLYDIILTDLRIDVNILNKSKEEKVSPAFYVVYRARKMSSTSELMPHPALSHLLESATEENIRFPPWDLPALVPPLPWYSARFGVDTKGRTKLIRRASRAQRNLLEESRVQDLWPCLDSLNALASVPWKVNGQVLDVVLQVFKKGGDTSLDIPVPQSAFRAPPTVSKGMDPSERRQAIIERQSLQKEKAEMFSLWCTELYKLSIASHYRDKVFWFGHNLDFRGRAYTTAPHLTHIGGDMSRAILKFAKGKPLGPNGLDWLKVHLINLTGLKKRSPLAERLEYANEIMNDILDSADNPLTGKAWWKTSEEPWQTLAVCMEVANAVRSPDPERFISHLPVHQDGSCNGLQHYAALGRDEAGAKSVNVSPQDAPGDVYSDVVALVEQERQKDARAGVQIAQALEGFLSRKVIKQTIMTTVYGVTDFGARAQIRRQLDYLDDFPKDKVAAGGAYLCEKTMLCLRQMFKSAREIQDWFVISAYLISNMNEAVQWKTPLDFPVIQDYYKKKRVELPPSEGVQESKSARKKRYVQAHVVNVRKQTNAFPPNFVHSLDATHMQLTALHCFKAGITFVSVHDCFWTHACDIEVMNKICREQFLALHKEPILQNLSKDIVDKFGLQVKLSGEPESVARSKKFINAILQNVPEKGEFEIEKVLNSVYFFS